MNRYYIPADQWEDSQPTGETLTTLTLSGDEAKHCSRVMRAREGDEIEIFDGEGRSVIAQISSVSRELVTCSVLKLNDSHQPSYLNYPITLCQAIPKGGNMELIVQKAVELGTSAIQPLITAHTIARPEALAKKQAKWQRIALEACKQCGQNYLPRILPALDFKEWVSKPHHYDTALVAALDERAVHLNTLFTNEPPTGSIALLVGPEGDLSTEEYQAAYQVGFSPITFGDIIMRVETATLYGLSVLQHELSKPSQ